MPCRWAALRDPSQVRPSRLAAVPGTPESMNGTWQITRLLGEDGQYWWFESVLLLLFSAGSTAAVDDWNPALRCIKPSERERDRERSGIDSTTINRCMISAINSTTCLHCYPYHSTTTRTTTAHIVLHLYLQKRQRVGVVVRAMNSPEVRQQGNAVTGAAGPSLGMNQVSNVLKCTQNFIAVKEYHCWNLVA